MGEIRGANGRIIDYVRISVTDRCNYRCLYCMPESGVRSVTHDNIMRYEDITFLCLVLSELGVRKVRFTGGEPLVRKGFVSFLIDFKKSFPDIAVSLTTNASLLAKYAPFLSDAGLYSMNISLDTLDREKFKKITRIGEIDDVREGIMAAKRAGIERIKSNTVLIRGFNDTELPDILGYAWDNGITPRFIEFMPLDCGLWRREDFLGARDALKLLEGLFGKWNLMEDSARYKNDDKKIPLGPAKYYSNEDGRVVGIIEAVSNHFCSVCNRLRVTASGGLRACLFAAEEARLLDMLRNKDAGSVKRAILDSAAAKPECWRDSLKGGVEMSGVGG
ncbi:cyclic pyranopterin monophosphate synthase [Synergistales bacterium]|nr:cyclic pyranopterin monophosphate synthase [Synergistales bacterium]